MKERKMDRQKIERYRDSKIDKEISRQIDKQIGRYVEQIQGYP